MLLARPERERGELAAEALEFKLSEIWSELKRWLGLEIGDLEVKMRLRRSHEAL
jgi:hypothetical protein